MNSQAAQEVIASLLLAEFSDTRRALVTDQALNPDEIRQLTLEAAAVRGTVAEADGRRLLVRFEQPDAAFGFAQTVQHMMEGLRARNPERHSLCARVILGHGPMVLDGGRPRSHWLHRLSGLVSRVPVHCIAALKNFVDQLPAGTLPAAPQTLAAELYLLKGADAAAVETQLASPLDVADVGVFTAITLRVRGVPRVFRAADCPILIGRDERCAVRVSSDTASRIHGRIEYVHGKFYYVDDSRNGSWVLIGSGEEVKLAKDRAVLTGQGAISPGAPLSQQKGEVVRYECQTTRLSMPDGAPGTDGDTKRL
ncbi:FHA domain-containing protein [Fontimonas sp. SYSU GA230001]|uniref:FHA domain-containing protein n=1 Tax=Fontimonas sp. SYSU GA230001 TaxID=3142450 RepID=UPI0032B33AD7